MSERGSDRSSKWRVQRLMPWILPLVLLLAAADARAQGNAQDAKPSMEIYGFAMLDIGHNFDTIDPNWFDTMRVTKLPSFEGEFGEDHNTFAGVRQTRLGVRAPRSIACRLESASIAPAHCERRPCLSAPSTRASSGRRRCP